MADARRVVAQWRRLTTPSARAGARGRGAGAGTLLAVSGGADSSAMALAMAALAGPARLVIGHVVHDLREPAAALADRDATRALADRLGLEFVERSVRVRDEPGNAEAAARRLRYRALAEMARGVGVRFVATAHHADDQLETVLMAMLRGAGPRGLAGIAERRRLVGAGGQEQGGGVWVVRPMLVLGRASAERLCRESGWPYRVDSTNADTTRLRAALRARVTPVLAELRPEAAARAVGLSRLMRGVCALVDRRSARLAGGSPVGPWARSAVRRAGEVEIGQLLRNAAAVASPGQAGADRLSARVVGAAVAAIKDGCTDPRRCRLGGVEVLVTAREVTVVPRCVSGPRCSSPRQPPGRAERARRSAREGR